MSDTEAKRLENDVVLCAKITGIIGVLSRAEKNDEDLYIPLKQVESELDDIDDEYLSSLHKRLLKGIEADNTDDPRWGDEYFAFILLLCNLLSEIENSAEHINMSEKIPNFLITA